MSNRSLSKKNHSFSTTVSDLLQRSIVLLFHFLVLSVPVFFLFKNEELFEFNKMILTYGTTVLIGTAWLCKMIIDKKVLLRRTPLDIPIALFMVSQVLSSLFSIHVRTSLFGYYTRFHGGLFSTFTYVMLFYTYVSIIKKSQQPALLRSMIFSALLVALYAIPEHFGYSFSCWMIAGNLDASCWIQDVQTRVFATFGQPNWLAAYAVMLIPIASSLFIASKTRTKNFVNFALFTLLPSTTAVLLFVTLLYTKSRSGILGLGGGALAFTALGLLALLKKDLQQSVHSRIPKTLGLAGIFVMIAVVIGTPFTPNLQTLIAQNTAPAEDVVIQEDPTVNRLEVGGTDSGEIRKIVWEGAFKVWQRYPLLGSGVETFAYSYFTDRPMEHNLVSEWDFLYNKAHNELLNFLATTGIVGLTTYILLQGAILWMIGKQAFNSKDLPSVFLYLGLFAGLVSVHISNFFGFSTVMVSILMYLFPAVALIAESKDEALSSSQKITEVQYLGILVTTGIGLYFLTMVWLMWQTDYLYARAKSFFQQADYANASQLIRRAISISPQEGLLYELQSKIDAQYAVALVQDQQLETATQLASESLDASDRSLQLNPVHLNFYKTRVQVLLTLAQAQPDFYQEALNTLDLARKYAPTDPKLVYNQAIIYNVMGESEIAEVLLREAIDMKPNYETARYQLAQLLERKQEYEEAAKHYQYILEYIAPANELVKERLEIIATFSASPQQ